MILEKHNAARRETDKDGGRKTMGDKEAEEQTKHLAQQDKKWLWTRVFPISVIATVIFVIIMILIFEVIL